MDLVLDYTDRPRTPDGLDRDRLLRLLDRYQAFIGHDLANQLVAMQAYARMLQEQWGRQLDEDGQALLSRLADLALLADTRSRKLAEVGRTLRQAESEQVLHLEEVIVMALASVKAGGEFAEVQFDKGACSGTFRAAGGLLHRTLFELLRNAAQAARQGDTKVVEIEAQRNDSVAVFTIRDSGPGMLAIPPALQPLGGEMESALQGTFGVGLLLVHQVTAIWRGRLKVSSAPYQGCTVILVIPEHSPSQCAFQSEKQT